jgi:hypothetical protein
MDALQTVDSEIAKFTAGNSLYNSYVDYWQYLMESYVGGEEYENAGHLQKYQLETPGEYAARLRNTPLQNHCNSIIGVYTSFIFKQPPTRNLGPLSNNPVVDEILRDADLDGRSFNSFMKDVSVYSSIFGHTWVCISKPNVGAVTMADEYAAGVRPYLSLITPLMALDWDWHRSPTGRYTLKYFRYIEEINGNSKTIKEWTPEMIRTITVDKEQHILEVVEEENGLGEIPIVCAYNKRGVIRGIGISDIGDIADQQRYIYNLLSEIEQTVRLDSHPSLAATENTMISSGAGSVIQMPDDLDPGLKPYILQSSGANIANSLQTITACVDSIDKMANTGAIRATESKSMSGVAMQTEFMMLASRLSEKADALELTEEHIWRWICRYLGVHYECEIDYPHQYNIRDNNSDLDFLIKARSSGVTNEYFQQEINRQIVELVVDDPILLNEINREILEPSFEIHDMTNPNTGETVTVTSEAQHQDLISRGFV